jgi:proline iminopeptidase
MILRGVFTCGWKDQDYFYSEEGAARFSPEAWDRLVGSLPPGTDRIQERLHRLLEEADDEGKRKWFAVQLAYEFSFFESPAGEPEEPASAFEAHFAEMRINAHYQAHRFFLEDEQILNNTHRLEDIPLTIVHGLRDVICPPMVAWRLHQRLPRSTLVLVPNAGHLSRDPGIERALLDAVSGWGEGSSPAMP